MVRFSPNSYLTPKTIFIIMKLTIWVWCGVRSYNELTDRLRGLQGCFMESEILQSLMISYRSLLFIATTMNNKPAESKDHLHIYDTFAIQMYKMLEL